MRPRPLLMSFLICCLLILSATAFSQTRIDSYKVARPANPLDGKTINFGERIYLYITSGDSAFKDKYANLRIFVNNIPMSSYKLSGYQLNDSSGEKYVLSFALAKEPDTLWNNWFRFGNNKLNISILISDASGRRIKEISDITVITYNRWLFNIALILSLFFVIATVYLCRRSSLIRDISSAQFNKPFSLSRFQLLWWSVIIIVSYAMLYSIREGFIILNTSTLVLLGISVSGTGFSRIIDNSDSDKLRHQDGQSRGFLYDILSDANGISIHRYQNLIFTLLFGLIFIYRVIETCNMPEFSSMELFLMGISTGTYVGIKSTENQNAEKLMADQAADDLHVKDEASVKQSPLLG